MNRQERSREIGKLIDDAMRAVTGVDWSKHSPEITKAQADLDEAMALYVDGETSRANVGTVYRKWRDLHKTGGLFAG